MTLGDPKRGFTAYSVTTEDVQFGHEVRKVAVPQFEYKLLIPDTFNIACPNVGEICLTGQDYFIEVEKFDDEHVLLTIQQKPQSAPYPVGEPLWATWLNQPFTRHLLNLSCRCPYHCQKCGGPLRYSEEWRGTRYHMSCPNPLCEKFVTTDNHTHMFPHWRTVDSPVSKV